MQKALDNHTCKVELRLCDKNNEDTNEIFLSKKDIQKCLLLNPDLKISFRKVIRLD